MADAKELVRQVCEIAARPLGEATAMPPGMYVSDEILELETRRIFQAEWICLGRAREIPNHGDFLTYKIGDQPVVAIRQSDGAVRAFANVCLHRMMLLLEGRGNAKRIVCPYHAWTYNCDGQLMGAPHMERSCNFKPRDKHLPELRCEIWEGWIYVSLNGDIAPVAERLADLHAVVARYRMADYEQVVTQDHVWDTNWKLLTENFMESYHLPVAHRATVGQWLPIEATRFPEAQFDAFTYETFEKRADAAYGLAHPDNTSLEGVWRYTSVMPTVYPTHMFVLAPDHLWYLCLQPQGTGQVRVRFGAALAPEVMASLDDPEGFVRDTIGFFDQVNAEDRFVVEGIHKGARAPLSAGGPLSWLEREIHDFIGYLAARLG